MKNRVIAIIAGLAMVAGSASAGLALSNGDFGSGATDWHHANTGANFWEGTWFDDANNPFPTSDQMAMTGIDNVGSWAYQDIGVNDLGDTQLDLTFNLGSFTNSPEVRSLGILVEVYQANGFAPGDNIDVNGEMLIDSFYSISGDLPIGGGYVSLNGSLDLAAANATDPLYLRFSNHQETGGPWAAVDNVTMTVIPEPATLGLVAVFGGAILFLRRKIMI